jgi:hypothetical protein
MPAVEGRDALLDLAPAVVISSMAIVADSTIGSGDFAATQGHGNWVSGPKGSDAHAYEEPSSWSGAVTATGAGASRVSC